MRAVGITSMLTATLLALAACERHAEQREAVTALMGRDITLPEGL